MNEPVRQQLLPPGAWKAKFITVPDIVESWINPHFELAGTRALEFGCGYGVSALGMALRKGVRRVKGVDVMPNAAQLLAWAAQELGLTQLPDNVLFETIRPGSLSEDGEQFDFAYAWSVFEHVRPDLLQTSAQQLFKSLRPGGLLLVQISPLFYSAYGSHLSPHIAEPWAHLLYDDGELKSKLDSMSGELSQEARDALWSTYRSLNKTTVGEIKDVFAGATFSLLREHFKHDAETPPSRLSMIYREDVLTTSQLVLLWQKPEQG